jgi:hypothetical protein
MLVDRINKEPPDISRDDLDMSWWLDEGETLTNIVTKTVMTGMFGWSEAPYPPPNSPPPYDPTPLQIQSAVIQPDGKTLEVFVKAGSAGVAYTCQFILDGSSTRRITIEMGVQVTGIPIGSPGSGPIPSYLAVTISDTPPIPAQCGQLWFDSKNPQLYVYYCDPTSSEWVIATGDLGSSGTTVPDGMFLPLTGGAVTGNLTINYAGVYANENASLTKSALNIAQTMSGQGSGVGNWIGFNNINIADTLDADGPDAVKASFTGAINGTVLTVTQETLTPHIVATCTSSISGTTMTITGTPVGTIRAGLAVQWPGGRDVIISGSGSSWTLAHDNGVVASQAMTLIIPNNTFVASISGSVLTLTGSIIGPWSYLPAGSTVLWNGGSDVVVSGSGSTWHLTNNNGTVPQQTMQDVGLVPSATIAWYPAGLEDPQFAVLQQYSGSNTWPLTIDQGIVNSQPMNLIGASAPLQAIGLYFNHLFGGPGTGGSRTGARFQLTMFNGPVLRHANYQGTLSNLTLAFPSGGTDLWSGAAGVGWGMGIAANLSKRPNVPPGVDNTYGPINYRGIAGMEIDYGVASGSADDPQYPKASAANVGGLTVLRYGSNQMAPAIWESDYGISVGQIASGLKDAGGNIVPPKAAKFGFKFGSQSLDQLNGRAIGVQIARNAYLADGTADPTLTQARHGVDWHAWDLTGTQFRGRGFSVLGSSGPFTAGAVQVGGGYLSANNTTVSLDTAGSVCTGATIAPGQGGAVLYPRLVLIHDDTGTMAIVTAVDGAVRPGIGAATSIVLVPNTGRAHSSQIPTNPVQFRATGNPITFPAPGPTGPKLNLTWTAPTTLALQPSGGRVQSMTTDWLSPLSGWHGAVSHAYVLTPTGIGGTALTGGALSTAGVNGLAIGITGLGFNQSAGSVNGAWGGYFEARQYPGATSYTQGIEVDVCNVSATDAVQGSPYINFPQPTSIGINLQSGGQVHSESPPLVAKAASVGIWVGDNDARFQTGIIFKNTALVGTDGTGTGTAQAVTMATGHQIQWYMPSGALGPSIGSQQTTGTPGQIVFENSRVHIVGGLFAPGGITVTPPTIISGTTTYTVTATDYTLIIAGTGTFTLTLPTSVGNVGRILILKNAVAFAVNSASSNVFPFAGGAAGTAIMPVGPSKFCWLQCDGTNWQMMMAN